MPNQTMNQNIAESEYPKLKTQMEKNSVEETAKTQMQAECPDFSWEDIRGLSWAFSDQEALIQDA
jgi:hypothetical protein